MGDVSSAQRFLSDGRRSVTLDTADVDSSTHGYPLGERKSDVCKEELPRWLLFESFGWGGVDAVMHEVDHEGYRRDLIDPVTEIDHQMHGRVPLHDHGDSDDVDVLINYLDDRDTIRASLTGDILTEVFIEPECDVIRCVHNGAVDPHLGKEPRVFLAIQRHGGDLKRLPRGLIQIGFRTGSLGACRLTYKGREKETRDDENAFHWIDSKPR